MTLRDTQKIRQAIAQYGRTAVDIAELTDEDDLYQAGLTSHASVNVMLALEDAFDVEFPDSLLKKQTFRSVCSIREALDSLIEPAPVA